jgi:hypothetical protein
MNKLLRRLLLNRLRSKDCSRQRSKGGIECIEQQLIQDLFIHGYLLQTRLIRQALKNSNFKTKHRAKPALMHKPLKNQVKKLIRSQNCPRQHG